MKISRLSAAAVATVVAATAVLAGTAPVPAAAAPAGTTCHAGTPAIAPATTQYFDPAQPVLGPARLPAAPPLRRLLAGYQRLGDLSEAAFLARYRSPDGWEYPPDDGFLVLGGKPVSYPEDLVPGERVDRFGYPGGAYLSPAHTLFARRALPPQNLTTPAAAPAANYHEYCVARAFEVAAGPIAPWFGQPGLGVQYKLDARYLPGAGTAPSVTWLLGHGYLVEEVPGR